MHFLIRKLFDSLKDLYMWWFICIIIVYNNKKDEDVIKSVYKRVRALANKKITNGIAKQWIAKELEMKRRV